MSTVYLEYKGRPVPVRDLRWQIISPCGCTCGVSTVEHGGGLTPDEAKSASNDGIAKLIKADPCQYVLLSHDDFPWDEMKSGTCPHIPKYGIVPLPTVDGYEWRAAGTAAHLCRSQVGEERNFTPQVCSDKYVSLSPAKYGVSMTVPCKRCVVWAKAHGGTR